MSWVTWALVFIGTAWLSWAVVELAEVIGK